MKFPPAKKRRRRKLIVFSPSRLDESVGKLSNKLLTVVMITNNIRWSNYIIRGRKASFHPHLLPKNIAEKVSMTFLKKRKGFSWKKIFFDLMIGGASKKWWSLWETWWSHHDDRRQILSSKDDSFSWGKKRFSFPSDFEETSLKKQRTRIRTLQMRKYELCDAHHWGGAFSWEWWCAS